MPTVNAWIPEKEKYLVEELKRMARMQKRSLSDIARQALREYSQKEEEKAKITPPPWAEDFKRFLEKHKELFTKALEDLKSGRYTPPF